MLLFCRSGNFLSYISRRVLLYFIFLWIMGIVESRDEDKIKKACYWPHEIFEPCFGGCAEVTCDNPRARLRPCYPYCEPGCVCSNPYVRDDRTHQCVLPPECTKTQMGIPLNGDPNANTMPPDEPRNPRNRRWNPPQEQHFDHPPSHHRKSPHQLEVEVPRIADPLQEYVARGPLEYSRLGNYFNIVIAPPPAKGLTWRKTMSGRGEQGGSHNNLKARRFEH